MRPFLFLLFALAMIAADQASKWFVMEHILRPHIAGTEAAPPDFISWYTATTGRIGPAQIEIIPHFNLVSTWNFGVSFGMLKTVARELLIGLAGLISAVFLVWLFRTRSKMQSLGIAMVIGGALGNMADRLRFGAVFDFLDFHAFDYHWPAFNIADSGIVLGVALLIIHSFLFENKYGTTYG